MGSGESSELIYLTGCSELGVWNLSMKSSPVSTKGEAGSCRYGRVEAQVRRDLGNLGVGLESLGIFALTTTSMYGLVAKSLTPCCLPIFLAARSASSAAPGLTDGGMVLTVMERGSWSRARCGKLFGRRSMAQVFGTCSCSHGWLWPPLSAPDSVSLNRIPWLKLDVGGQMDPSSSKVSGRDILPIIS